MTIDLPVKLVVALLTLSIQAVAEEPLRLETQFGETVTVLGDGQPRIIVYADREGAKQTPAWGEALESAPCPAAAVAHLSAVPEFFREMVRDSFREEEPVALDWEGRLGERLDFRAGAANVYLLDSRGRVQIHLHGRPGDANLSRLRSLAERTCTEQG